MPRPSILGLPPSAIIHLSFGLSQKVCGVFSNTGRADYLGGINAKVI